MCVFFLGIPYISRTSSTDEFQFDIFTNESCIQFITIADDSIKQNLIFNFSLAQKNSIVEFQSNSISIEYEDDDECK